MPQIITTFPKGSTNPEFRWMDTNNPLPKLQDKWVRTGALEPKELEFLHEARRTNPDIRVKETCRVLIAAINGQSEGEPHVQHLISRRTLELAKAKIIRQY